MKVAALISGGKDSCYNMMKCIEEGHDIVALVNLQPATPGETDSYMYQTTGQEIIPLYQLATQIPLYTKYITGRPNLISFDYEPTMQDEVENLYEVLKEVKGKEGVEGVSVGAIFSEYQSNRVQNVCDRLGLQMLAYLWRREQKTLLQEMIGAGVVAVVVKVASLGLDQRHLGMTLDEIQPHLLELNDKYGSNVCGEGGEFETVVLDCPLFKAGRIVIEDSNVVEHSADCWYLRINKSSIVGKE